jgi:Flp pilus assembly pilin Flp
MGITEHKNSAKTGQALLEYLLIIAFISLFSIKVVSSLSTFLGDSFGSLADILSSHLTVGVCENFCFHDDFSNGATPGGNAP